LGRKLKAICDGIRGIYGAWTRARIGGEVTQAADAEGQDGGDGAQAFFGCEGVGVGEAHGKSPVGAAHSDLRRATGELSGGIGNAMPLPVYLRGAGPK
jgi:hypothetical protein